MNDVLKKRKTKRTFTFTIRKKDLKFLGYIIKKEGLGNLILAGHTESRRDTGGNLTNELV